MTQLPLTRSTRVLPEPQHHLRILASENTPRATPLTSQSLSSSLNIASVIPHNIHSTTPLEITVAIPISSELENQIIVAPLAQTDTAISAIEIDRNETPLQRYHLEYNAEITTRNQLNTCIDEINHAIQNHCEHPLAPCIVKTIGCTTAATTTACLLGSQCIGSCVFIASFFVSTGFNLMTDMTRLEN